MDSTFELYSMEGDEAAFWQERPNLDAAQLELLRCYYDARREGKYGEKCSRETLLLALQESSYETDLALTILQNLDDHYLKLCADKLKRQAK